MSYILNALRKSENERKTKEQSVNLQTSDSLETPLQNTKTVWLIITLICINILVLIYFVFFSTQISKNTITEIEQQAANVKPSKTIDHHPTASVKTKPAKTDAIKKEHPQPVINPVSVESSHQASISDMLKQQGITNKTVITTSNKKIAIPTARTTKKAMNRGELTKVKQTDPKTESNQKQRPQPTKSTEIIPFLREMPPEFRRRVPNLNINVFVYAEEPENRFVIIDMKKYRTGEETDTGLKIKEINKENLILIFNNRRFQVKRP